MRPYRAGFSSAALLLASALPLALLSCVNQGTDLWTIKGHATITYLGQTPVPSGDVSLTMNVLRDDHPIYPFNKTWSGSFTNGDLDIPNFAVDLAYEQGFYKDKIRWVLSTVNGGMYYADTTYFFPLLRIEDPAERIWTMEFIIREQPPDQP